jgi:hypothetical protein
LAKAVDGKRNCFEKGIIRFGFGSAESERYRLCLDRKWDDVKQLFLSQGLGKGTATRFANEMRLFFEDDGSTLLINFIGEKLCWGFLSSDAAQPHVDGEGVQRTVSGGWRWHDVNGEPLTKERLSGALTKLASYRGTSCDVDVEEYVTRRVSGLKSHEVEHALAAREAMIASVLGLMRLLQPRDFELLVELVSSTSGWRRLSPTGETQKTIDLALMLPSTGERAFVQVKSQTSSAELAEYISRLEATPYQRMFYVYHSGEPKTENERVIVIGPDKMAALVLDAGLVNWLIDKVS